MRIALGVEYDGRGFSGWQTQPNGNTVQDALERAVAAIVGAPVRCHAAGRTDAGVHATGQVAHLDCDVPRPPGAWVRGVNSHLPPGVAVCWAQPVPEHFHSRFSAYARCYRYVLLNRPVRPAIAAGQVGWFHAPLEVEAMREASAYLLGQHDFSSFRAAECQAKTPVKTLTRLDIERVGDTLTFSLEADAFLHHMVRNLVGALLMVGKGGKPAEWMAELLAARSRASAPPTFMPDGLYLTGVRYPEEFGLPSPPPLYGPRRQADV